eukprot:10307271-Ditylum_brightwellii.AAC.1
MTSYRTELTGILADLYLILALAQHSDTTISTQQEIFCHNAAAVVHANTPIAPGICSYIAVDYDLSQEIATAKSSGIDLKTSWVKAHQDEKKPLAFLPIKAKLNVKADADVTTFLQNTLCH